MGRYVCKWCGEMTEAVDRYVICPRCVRDLHRRLDRHTKAGGDTTKSEDVARSLLTPEERARVRKLLHW
jgi:hypothetical protein